MMIHAHIWDMLLLASLGSQTGARVRRHLRRRGPQRASAAPPATALRPCRAARAVAARSGHWPPLVPHSQPSRSSAPASGGGATALAAASLSAVAAAAFARFTARSSAARIAFHRDEGGCQMLGQHEHPAPPGRLHHLPGRRATGGRQPSAQRFCNARPSGSFAVASTPPKGCSAAMGKGHHSYSLPTAAHREQDMEARRETRGAPRARAGWGISAASGPRHRDTRRHTRGTAGHEGCK